MLKQMMILYILSSLAFADSGEEIKIQEVRYDEYALQYAVIRQVNNFGLDRKVMCTDCTATATIQDNEGFQYFKDRSMRDMKNGLFGVQILRSEIPFEGMSKNVFFIVNITSTQYGSSLVSSQLVIVNTENPNIGYSWDDLTKDLYRFWGTPVNYVANQTSSYMPDLKESLISVVATITEPLLSPLRDSGVLGVFSSIVGFFGGVIQLLLSVVESSLSYLVKLVANPISFFKNDFWPLTYQVSMIILYIVFVPFILYLGGSMLYILPRANGDFFRLITEFIGLQIYFLKAVISVSGFVINLFVGAYFLVMNILHSIPALSHLWSSSPGNGK